MNSYLEDLGFRAKKASQELSTVSVDNLNACLIKCADLIEENGNYIIEENKKDVVIAEQKGVKASLIDRLRLTVERIKGISEGLRQVATLSSPVGEITYSYEMANGLKVNEKRVPFGVIGIIYESRPNVTADAFGLCFKTANAVILRGGSDAINSNKAITTVLKKGLNECGITVDAVNLIEDTSRQTVEDFMRLNKYVDLLIPRGGAGLIKTVTSTATVPVIETGTGNCHIYVDKTADIKKAVNIIVNAKTQRYGVCNACESLVVHQDIAPMFLPEIKNALYEKNVEIRGDEFARKICPDFVIATSEDFATEYLDAIISVKTVSSVAEAIQHINDNNTKHSESIITEDENSAEEFINGVDAAAVYVNASTRFTDGFEFGFGAEIGISTQKLHARGPMGLKALTTTKYVCTGNGQIRK